MLQSFWQLHDTIIHKFTGKPTPAPSVGELSEGQGQNTDGQFLSPAELEKQLQMAASGSMDWAEVNRRYAMSAAAFSSQTGLREVLTCVSLLLKPAMGLLHSQLDMAGDDWEKKQQFSAASGEPRTYRVLEKHQLLHTAFSSVLWQMFQVPAAIPLSSFTRRVRSLLFRLLSQFVCALEFTMRRFHRSFPDQLFTLLDKRHETIQHVYGLPHCLRDYLAKDFFKSYPEEAACPEALAYLEALASMTDTDISSVEAGHASTREYTMQRNRGKVPTLQDVSAQTVFRFIAKRYAGNEPSESHARRAGQDQQQDSESQGKKKKQYNYCGPWKAFVHERLAGTAISKLNMPALAEEYRNLSHDEYQHYADLGLASSLKTARASIHTEVDVSSICHKDADTLALVSSQSLSMHEYEDFLRFQSQQQRKKTSENQALQKRIDETLSQLKPVAEVVNCLKESGGPALPTGLRGLPTGQISGVHFHEWTPPATQLAEERVDSGF